MEVRFYLIDGEVFRYKRDDVDFVRNMFKTLKPARIFSNRQIIINDGEAVSGFNTDTIEYVEFITDEDPGWHTHPGVARLVCIDKEEFEKKIEEGFTRLTDESKMVEQGEVWRGVVDCVMVSGKRIYFEFESVASSKYDIRTLLQSFFDPVSFQGKLQDKGNIIINSKNIARWVLLPSPPETPEAFWEMKRLNNDDD